MYSKTEDLKIFDCPPTPAKASPSKYTPAKVSPSKSHHSEDEAIEDESGEISDCDENSEIDYSIKIYASLKKQSSSFKEGEDSLASELGYCIVDMAKFLKITSSNSENEREHVFRDYEKADYKDDETEEYKGEILARGKSIIIETSYNSSDDRPSIARESNVFSISNSEYEEVKNMKLEDDSNSKGTAKVSGKIGVIRNSAGVKLDKNSTDKEKQIGKMVVVSGRYTISQSDSVIVGIPGCSVMKTWRVRNDSNYSWPKDVYLKCLTEGVDCSLPSLKRHLNPREETDISIKINIPEDAENNKVLNYAFAVCSREYSDMGDKLIATVQISKELFEKKALELKQNQT